MTNIQSILIVVVFIAICVILMGYLYWMLILFSKDIIFFIGKKKMFKSVGNILVSYYRENEYDQCISELEIVYKHIINGNDELERYYGNIETILEKYLIEFNADQLKKYDFKVEEKDKNQFKKYILSLIHYYNKIFPMNILDGANNVLIKQLIDYRDDKENDKYEKTVEEVAIEIKQLQDTVYEKDKSKKRQDVIGIISIILSIFFGVISFIQFLS